jgi:hypothetical protein
MGPPYIIFAGPVRYIVQDLSLIWIGLCVCVCVCVCLWLYDYWPTTKNQTILTANSKQLVMVIPLSSYFPEDHRPTPDPPQPTPDPPHPTPDPPQPYRSTSAIRRPASASNKPVSAIRR